MFNNYIRDIKTKTLKKKPTLPALCAGVHIVELDFGINNLSFVVPSMIGKLFIEDTVWRFTTAGSIRNFYLYVIMYEVLTIKRKCL